MARLDTLLVTERTSLSARVRSRRYRRDTVSAYLYILPATAILVVFHFLPVFYAFYISLFNWRIARMGFVGLGNYQRAVTNPDFWYSLLVTLFYVLGTVPVTLTLAFLIAYILFKKVFGRAFYRMVYFVPYVTSTVAAALVWKWIFHKEYGIANYLFSVLGIPTQKWLFEPTGVFHLLGGYFGFSLPDWAGGPSLALVAIMIFSIWHAIGFAIVIMLAGLGNISPELYDAARIDGAGEWSILRNITLPLMSPTLFFLSIISVIGSFQAFNQIYVMTNGEPLGTTRNVTMSIFSNFYEYTKLGYASAIAFVLLFIILGLTLFQMRVLGQRVHY